MTNDPKRFKVGQLLLIPHSKVAVDKLKGVGPL
jgi:hypothetical protein